MQQRRKVLAADHPGEIEWREWSKEAFDEARYKNRLVLLDLTASWCHWCHVMDETTYSDPEVTMKINDNFVPIRVDIDRRPDISERYNRGGFPTTAILSDTGESIWGSTYIPPADMLRIIDSILRAKASGEVDQALERSRMQFLDTSKACEKKSAVTHETIDSIFEDIFSSYDAEFGGFGIQPKFPQPDVVDLLLERYAVDHDQELAEAVTHTLSRMAEGLFDKVEGGVFRYSVSRDWRTPHYEKMLETNLGFLRNLVHAYKILGESRFETLARGTAEYLFVNLRNPESGGFFGSQNADEDYYKLDGNARAQKPKPSIDKTIYAGWNAAASSVMISAGALLRENRFMDAGRAALEYALRELWNPKLGLARHTVDQEVYLFSDQAELLEALVANMQISPDKRLTRFADSLLKGVEDSFPKVEGAYSDVMKQEDAVGELGEFRKDLMANAKWAMNVGLIGAVAHKPGLFDAASSILHSLNRKDLEAYGVFAASYIRAWWVLEKGPVAVEVHTLQADPQKEEMWRAVKDLVNPAVIALISNDLGEGEKPYAIACTPTGCSEKVHDLDTLHRRLGAIWSSQV